MAPRRWWPSQGLAGRLAVGGALGACLAACGGATSAPSGHGTPARTQASASAPAGRSAYRWLVPVTGTPPSVAAENRQPGTRAWRLPGPPAQVGGLAFGSVSGYVGRPSVSRGQIERIYVNAPGARQVQIRVFRIGWYQGSGGREVLRTRWLPARRQPPCRHVFGSGLTECRWRPTLTFRVPPGLPSGVYIAKLTAPGSARDCLFVVRTPAPAPLLVQLPTATYQAYNAWGGDSLYPGGTFPVRLTGTTQGSQVSYDRPYDSVTGAGQFFARDVAMVRFLERYRYPVAYTTSESVDSDPRQVLGRRGLIDIGHSEYWSSRQVRAFAAALRSGTSLLFFSSDLIAQPIRFAPASAGASQAGQPGETIIARGGLAGGRGGQARGDLFRARAAALTGAAFLGCITPRLPGLRQPTYRYYSWSPNPSLKPGWLFHHTGFAANTRIRGIVGYELDGLTAASPRGARVLGGGFAPCLGTGERPGATRLQAGGDHAQTTLRPARSGAIVFDSATMGWELGLDAVPSASPDAPRAPDARLVRLTRNLLGHVLGGR